MEESETPEVQERRLKMIEERYEEYPFWLFTLMKGDKTHGIYYQQGSKYLQTSVERS